MEQIKTYKRFSVDAGGRLVAVFDTIEDAREFVASFGWFSIASIYDHEERREVETFIII